MALTIACASERTATVEEVVEQADRLRDLDDPNGIATLAPLLGALANDRELIVRLLNWRLRGRVDGGLTGLAQSIALGQGQQVRLRANIWPSTADLTAGRVQQGEPAYDVAHDHNYHFLTAAYFGAGYITEIYEYDHDAIEGYVGEAVELRFLERTKFVAGRAMLYRGSRDVHVQYPPEDISITLSLMFDPPALKARDQYLFDLQRQAINGFGLDTDTARRVDAVAIAGYAGNGDTCQLLGDLARRHPCRRTRLTAYESLVRLLPDDAVKIWERACDDRAPLVANEARARLSAMGRS
ncbi:MAG: hypothetical protein ACT6T0_06405 [Nevskia sp.]|uniref:hypothetical protein n=1 Tax=Nevskia sp. TaxID=1929292 RepID=UPI0040353358